jgi:hypothetical protein
VGSYDVRYIRQLLTAHVIAEQHLGIPGLPVGPVLDAARAAGRNCADPIISSEQRKVASTVQQLGYTVQLERKSPDGLMSVDAGVTALPDGTPCSIAVEFDGTYHYVASNTRSNSPSNTRTRTAFDRLNGPTRLRNALLQARFTDGVVCIPWFEWVAARRRRQQEEYLRRAMATILNTKVRMLSAEFLHQAAGYEHHTILVQPISCLA